MQTDPNYRPLKFNPRKNRVVPVVALLLVLAYLPLASGIGRVAFDRIGWLIPDVAGGLQGVG